MMLIICILPLLLHMISIVCETPTHKIETDNVIAAIQEKAKNPEKPGAVDDIVALYEKLKGLDPEAASTLSSYVDRLKIFQSNQEPPKPNQEIINQKKDNPLDSKKTISTIPTITNESTVKEKVIEKLAQTAEAIKKAATTNSKAIQEKGQELCKQLPSIDLKSAKEAVINKAIEIQQACTNLKTKLIAKEEDTVASQTKKMNSDILKEAEKGNAVDEDKIKQLCESVKQAAANFKEKAEEQWDTVKNTCTPFIKQPQTKEPINIQKPDDKDIVKPNMPVSNTNPFSPELNPFLSDQSNQNLIGGEKVTANATGIASKPTTRIKRELAKAIEKKAPTVKKTEERINDAPYLLVNSKIAELLESINKVRLQEMNVAESTPTYSIDKPIIKEIQSVYDLYKKLSNDHKEIVSNTFTFAISEYTEVLLKQINAIVPFVQNSLEKRINYLVLWLDINANLACQETAPPQKEEPLSFSALGGWLTSKAEETAANIKKQTEALKKKAETIICSDDELLFTQKDKEWQAVTTKTQIDKMIEEYNNSIAIIQKGIAEPIEQLMNIDDKKLVPTEKINTLQKVCNKLIELTESAVNFKENINKSKEEFFKDNGSLTTLYNLWIRYLNKYIIKKGNSTWNTEQKKAFDAFNKKYFIPLHETMKQLQKISSQESAFKKIVKEVDSYVKNKD